MLQTDELNQKKNCVFDVVNLRNTEKTMLASFKIMVRMLRTKRIIFKLHPSLSMQRRSLNKTFKLSVIVADVNLRILIKFHFLVLSLLLFFLTVCLLIMLSTAAGIASSNTTSSRDDDTMSWVQVGILIVLVTM